METIRKIQENPDDYLNEDNHYGTFYVEGIIHELARFGRVPNSKYEIHIEGGEGNVPHMHICIKTGKNIVLRVCLLRNTYFREKDDIKNTLNSSERIALDKYLNSIYNEEFGITKWQNLCMTWNEYNPGHPIKNIKSLVKPDYTIINEP